MFGLFRRKIKPAEPEITPVEPEKRRIYVLDFDRTITKRHTGALAYGKELTPKFILRNIKKGFDDFVYKVTGQGHSVYIASYNDDANVDRVNVEALSGHGLIKFYMDLVFGIDQTHFTPLDKNDAGKVISNGNIIALNSQDLKQYHFHIIVQKEGFDQDNPEDMKRIYLLDDDENVVRFYMEKGCNILIPFSVSRSADTAATNKLFTAYMPVAFITR
ncbi:hypothetical protein ACFLYW_01400 [Thermodesulfobacteriota bacterium]